MSARGSTRALLHLVVAGAITGCGWTELDATLPGLEDAQLPEDVARSVDGRPSSDGGDGGAEATPAIVCNGDDPNLDEWMFDTADAGGWELVLDKGVEGSLDWLGTVGKPAKGAVAITITSKPEDGGAVNGGWLNYPHAFGDLSTRTMAAWAWLESGESPNLKLFAQTGSQYVWADNGTVHLQPHVWTCVSLPLATPSYTQPDYDPTDVIDLGFELLGSGPFKVYLDTVRIY